MTGGWSLGILEQSRERAAVDCAEMDSRDVRKETVVGHACRGKPCRHGSKAIMLSHPLGVKPSP